MVTLVETAQARVERVEVAELPDGTFFAELAVSGPAGERRVDSRPSDAIALAVRVDAPLFVAGAVLDEAGAVLAEAPDEEAIDDEAARFRAPLEAFDRAQALLTNRQLARRSTARAAIRLRRGATVRIPATQRRLAQPLTTPRGTSRTTRRARPACSTVATTASTSL
jgi:hypothetical protein